MQTTTTTKPVVSRAKAYLKVRHKSVRDAMKELKLDAILLTHAADLSYLTNFTGEDSVGLITAEGVLPRHRLPLQGTGRARGRLGQGLDPRREDVADALAKTLVESGATRIGFEANYTTVGQLDALERALKELREKDGNARPIEFVGLQDVMQNIRKVKDDHEIDLVRKSVALAEEAFNAIRDEIKVGQTENYLAGLLVFELRSRGASNSSFPVIVAAGTNSSLPHYRPGETLVQRDQPLPVRLGRAAEGLLLGPHAHADDRPRQPADQADLQGRSRGPGGGDQVPAARA